jgi:hypothetical protein
MVMKKNRKNSVELLIRIKGSFVVY